MPTEFIKFMHAIISQEHKLSCPQMTNWMTKSRKTLTSTFQIYACFKLAKTAVCYCSKHTSLVWNSRAQKLCGLARVAKLVWVIHHYWGDYPPLVAQLFGQWHQHASRGLYICCWVGDDRVICVFMEQNSVALSAADGLRDTKHGVRGLEVIFWVEMSLRLKLISYQLAALLIWKKGAWPTGGNNVNWSLWG